MNISNTLHSQILNSGDLNQKFDIKTALVEEPGELYFNHRALFNKCPLCCKDASNSDASFNYIYKCPYKSITLYNNVKIKMHYKCLKIGIHIYLLNNRIFPKMRRDGNAFHINMLNLNKQNMDVNQLEKCFKEGKYIIKYEVPKYYDCDYYSKFGNDILESLKKDYEI
tara:strand:+ start:49 stop:552 length:504 start_codon:yes stop_codon:yes gene_type:complete